jgi:hypothetical protein
MNCSSPSPPRRLGRIRLSKAVQSPSPPYSHRPIGAANGEAVGAGHALGRSAVGGRPAREVAPERPKNDAELQAHQAPSGPLKGVAQRLRTTLA